MAEYKNAPVMTRPSRNVSHGNSPVVPGTKIPTTSEAKIIFAPSLKKPTTKLTCSRVSIFYFLTSQIKLQPSHYLLQPNLLFRRHQLQKRFFGDFHPAGGLHGLFTFLLLFQEFALAGPVAAIQVPGHVFAIRFNIFPSNDFSAMQAGLNRHGKQLFGNKIFKQFADARAFAKSPSPRHDPRKRLNQIVGDNKFQFYQIALAVPDLDRKST